MFDSIYMDYVATLIIPITNVWTRYIQMKWRFLFRCTE